MSDKQEMSHKEDVTKSMSTLSLNTSTKAPKKATKKKKEVVADSWEDEDISDPDPENEDDGKPSTPAASSTKESLGISAPPPTPISPTYLSGNQYQDNWSSPSSSQAESGPRRPEKTDAVARRMIAASLGLKAPKQTEEQKAYQKSVREQERKRREQQKEEEQRQKEKAEQAKAAVWDD